ncbi:MAG TPA: hypothetical protein VJP86_11740 [Vicinamibacterales bacterium]|jgi:hypothetical protein|nr:hypothetical protein [Vicinamibacterales bacterium]
METSDVRRQVLMTIERARRSAAERRAQSDRAAGDYDRFLSSIAVPIFKQIANTLRPEGFAFRVFTPSGSVRLMSESRSDDYIELSLDTSGAKPVVMGTTRVARGHRLRDTEAPISDKPVAEISEQDVLDFVLAELEAFIRP